jgi:hypothetical protein
VETYNGANAEIEKQPYLCIMLPDYPHKLFSDHRSHFNLLMEALAMDAPNP